MHWRICTGEYALENMHWICVIIPYINLIVQYSPLPQLHLLINRRCPLNLKLLTQHRIYCCENEYPKPYVKIECEELPETLSSEKEILVRRKYQLRMLFILRNIVKMENNMQQKLINNGPEREFAGCLFQLRI